MSLTTYTLIVRENESTDEIVAEVRSDGTIENSTRLSYTDYGLTAVRDGWVPDERRDEVTADVMTTRLQTERVGDGFLFRLLGDGETLTEQRVTDDEWNVVTVE
ncbi:hypothetical protein [Haladaptatus caseinilyticus]|uniref:hypothetical protein n=1 Tax=Haladaptatus caseinilyticus TaxID=2993314 RepID=UPI00224A69C6|nr:hypothetical protein [Haladaptatus caseinilyticus]